MSRHAVRATVAVAALSLAVLSSPIQAQDKPSAQELADLRALAEAGDTEAQYNLGLMYFNGRGVAQDDVEAVAWYHQAPVDVPQARRATPDCSGKQGLNLWSKPRP